MRPIERLIGLAYACSLLACGSNDSEPTAASASACVAGSSVACAGPSGCRGYQICRADGSAFDSCICEASNNGAGGSRSETGGSGADDGSRFGSGGSSSTFTRNVSGTANGGGSATSPSTTASVGGQSSSTTVGVAPNCAPTDTSGQTYPPYKPARRMPASCTPTDVRTYYADCYTAGNCAEFAPGSSKSKCGECLAPTTLDADTYGPLIRLGTAATPLDETNMAGCIELLGEAQCAKKMIISALCEYYSCATSCTVTDSASYQALTNCMMDARSSSCSAAEREAVCISNSAHVAACSASGFEAQFNAIANVFCVQSN